MPPKKKHEQHDQPILLGRLGTNLKCGIVGLPNVGYVYHFFFFFLLLLPSASSASFLILSFAG